MICALFSGVSIVVITPVIAVIMTHASQYQSVTVPTVPLLVQLPANPATCACSQESHGRWPKMAQVPEPLSLTSSQDVPGSSLWAGCCCHLENKPADGDIFLFVTLAFE